MNKSVRTKQVLDSVCPGYQSRSTGPRGQAVVKLVSEKQPRDAWAFPAVEQAQATPSTNDHTVTALCSQGPHGAPSCLTSRGFSRNLHDYFRMGRAMGLFLDSHHILA